MTESVMQFTNMSEVKDYLNSKRISCLFCHKTFKALSTHLGVKHDITVADYKTRFGLPQTLGLTSIKTKEKMSLHMLKQHADPAKQEMFKKSAFKGQATFKQRSATGISSRRKRCKAVLLQAKQNILKIKPRKLGIYSNKFTNKIALFYGKGFTFYAIGKILPVTDSCLYRWYKNKPEFRVKLEQARK